MSFDIYLHVGTLLALLVFFGRDIVQLIKNKRLDWLFYIAVGTVPAVAAALLWGDGIAAFFEGTRKASYMLIATSVFLFAGQVCLKREATADGNKPGVVTSILVGIAQAVAILPGLSRSGATISTGLLRGLKAEDAFRFSFLLSIPAIAGAAVYEYVHTDVVRTAIKTPGIYLAGISAAFIVGFVSLFFLRNALKKRYLYLFGIYCFLLGACGIIFGA